MQVNLQPGYVLHRRPYRDTSYIVDFFTRDYGRVSAVAKGARQSTKKRRFVLEPFQPLLLSWFGKQSIQSSGLQSLQGAESQIGALFFTGDRLYSALYLNEILVRLLPEQEPHEIIFQLYTESLVSLSVDKPVEPVLRNFELSLLEEMGLSVTFSQDVTGADISSGSQYHFIHNQGFVPVVTENKANELIFDGEDLRIIADRNWQIATDNTMKVAKFLCRQLLAPLLGRKPLQSRNLFLKKS